MKEIVQKHCKSPDTKVLILLEHEGQVKDCLEWFSEIKGRKQIIALSPFAIYELDRQTMPYKILEDYYDSRELYQLGMDNWQRAETFCGIIDKRIHKACPFTVEQGIKPALFSLFYLKIVYDAATVRLFQLFKVIEAEKPDVIFIYDTKCYPFGISEKASYLLFDNRESVYTQLLKLTGWEASVAVLPYIQQPEEPIPRQKAMKALPKFKDKVAKWLLLHPRLYELAIAIRKRNLKSLLPQNKKMPVLFFGWGYNWNDCREELQSAGIAPIFTMPDYPGHWLGDPFSERVNSGSLPDIWQELQTDGEFRRFFVWQDIDFFPVVRNRLLFLVERLTLACLKAYEEVSGIIRNRGIKAVLASSLSTCTSRSAAQAAHSAGIPVITWQHGNYGYMGQPITIYNDIMDADTLFVFGEGVVEKYAESARRLGTQLIPLGSTSLEALSQRKPRRKVKKNVPLNLERKSVLYVVISFYENSLYIALLPPFSDNHYWHTQRTILDTLARHQDYTIVVKTHPSHTHRETPLRQYAREKGFGNCLFIRDECSFKDLLPLADVLVIDWPSTTLLEALTTSKPIFVYTGHHDIDDHAVKLLERRAFCHQELEDFVDALDKFLSGGIMDTDFSDTEFLKRFGTADGESGRRAAEALIDIIRSYPK